MDILSAVRAPRIHSQLLPPIVHIEDHILLNGTEHASLRYLNRVPNPCSDTKDCAVSNSFFSPVLSCSGLSYLILSSAHRTGQDMIELDKTRQNRTSTCKVQLQLLKVFYRPSYFYYGHVYSTFSPLFIP